MNRYFSRTSIVALNDDEGTYAITKEQYDALTLDDHAARIIAEWADVDGNRGEDETVAA